MSALRILAVLLLAWPPAISPAAQPKPLRVAVGPFFAPVGNEKLQQASKVLPELLTVALSGESKFQLVEREKVQAIWSELNLTAAGLVARENVLKVGRVLACDWLISGSFVQASGRTHIWTKLIDIRTGIVLDLNDSPYDGADFSQTVPAIAAFLAKAGSSSKGRQFIVMGPFVDMNPVLATNREDWSRRVPAAIEKHFHDAGFGVVELAAITPIFEERRLESAGLTGHPEQRVQLQPAFWLVDGGCEWAENQDLGIGLRVQKIGGPEQMFRVAVAPGPDAEKAVVETITRALSNTNEFAPALAAKAEADLLTRRGMELAARNSPFRQKIYHTGGVQNLTEARRTEELQKQRGLANRNAALATYERTLLLDPKNPEAKTMLGYALLGDEDPARREHGKELLKEVVASNDPKYAEHAQRHLANADMMARMVQDRLAGRSTPSVVPSTYHAGPQKAVPYNPTDSKSKYEWGVTLLGSSLGNVRARGQRVLREVAASGDKDFADLARQKLSASAPNANPAAPPAAAAGPVGP